MHNYHLMLQGGHWALVKDGSAPAIKSFCTKREGVMYSLSYIEHYGGSLTILKLDGGLQEERTYPGSMGTISIAA